MAINRETLEFVHGAWWFCQRGTYGKTSVLEGQEYRRLGRPYDTLEQAQAEHPKAKVCEEGRPGFYMPETAPEWFDPMDAGEVWSENDY
jgi:hypothetical protein